MKKLVLFVNQQKCMRGFSLAAFLLIFFFSSNYYRSQVQGYIFAQTTEPFSLLSSETVLATASSNFGSNSLQNRVFTITLPFSFQFNGVAHTTVHMSSNGYVVFGTTPPGTSNTTPISNTATYEGVVAAYGRSNNAANGSGTMGWAVEGTPGNREVIFQWKNFRPTYGLTGSNFHMFSYQIRLIENGNKVKVKYGPWGTNGNAGTFTAAVQVGLRGATNADFNNRKSTGAFDTSTAGGANGDTQALSAPGSTPGVPPAGLTYTWTPPSCPAPENITVSNITLAGAEISWDPSMQSGVTYDVYYSTDPSTLPSSSTTPIASGLTAPTYTMANLQPSTMYYYYVRTRCSATELGVWSAQQSFHTVCAPVTSLQENFDALPTGPNLPLCWDRIVGTGTQEISSIGVATGTRNMYQYATASQTPTIVVLPEMANINDGTHRLRFKARMQTGTTGTLEVGYVTDLTDATTFVVIESLQVTNLPYTDLSTEYTVMPFNLPPGARLAIKNSADSYMYMWDDVVWEPTPLCEAPTDLVLTGLTGQTADVEWQTMGGQDFEVYYSTSNTPPTSTTTPTVTSINGTQTQLTGLTEGTKYYYWVRTVCGNDTSNWSIMGSFITICTPVTTMNEGFEGVVAPDTLPLCWFKTTDIAPTGSQGISTSGAAAGSKHLTLSTSATQTPVVVVLPEFSNIDLGTHHLKFQSKVNNVTGSLEVGYVSDIFDANSFIQLGVFSIANTAYSSTGSEYILQPMALPTGVRLAFRAPADGRTYSIDSVVWEEAPTCAAPTNIAIGQVTGNNVGVSWDASTSINPTYEIYYSTSSTPPTSSTVPQVVGVTSTSTTVTLPNAATLYYIWVRSNCGGGSFSPWALEVNLVYTGCAIPDVSASGVTVCYDGTATLSGTSSSASAEIRWYDSAAATTVYHTGASLVVPNMTADREFWVSAANVTEATLGKTTPNATAGSTLFNNYGLQFNAITPLIIKEADLRVIGPGTTGTINISLMDSSGNVLDSTVATVNVGTTAVLNTIPLNFNVPSGVGHKLVITGVTGITSIIRDFNTGVSYPYSAAGVAEITAGVAGTTLATNYYYYFYNIKVKAVCESARMQVNADVDFSCTAGIENVIKGEEITIAPNPFIDRVKFSDIRNIKDIQIFDGSGRLVKKMVPKDVNINLQDLDSGLYFIHVNYTNHKAPTTHRVVKK